MTLINKESLLLVMNTLSENADPSVLDWEFAVDVVRTAPEADPVRHGKWIGKTGVLYPEENDGICSSCCYVTGFYKHFRYCPNCGARMDGEDGAVD